MMEHTTWLTADQAVERGLVDAVMFRDGKEAAPMTAGPLFSLPTKEQMEKADRAMREGAGEPESSRMANARLNFLKLQAKGERRA